MSAAEGTSPPGSASAAPNTGALRVLIGAWRADKHRAPSAARPQRALSPTVAGPKRKPRSRPRLMSATSFVSDDSGWLCGAEAPGDPVLPAVLPAVLPGIAADLPEPVPPQQEGADADDGAERPLALPMDPVRMSEADVRAVLPSAEPNRRAMQAALRAAEQGPREGKPRHFPKDYGLTAETLRHALEDRRFRTLMADRRERTQRSRDYHARHMRKLLRLPPAPDPAVAQALRPASPDPQGRPAFGFPVQLPRPRARRVLSAPTPRHPPEALLLAQQRRREVGRDAASACAESLRRDRLGLPPDPAPAPAPDPDDERRPSAAVILRPRRATVAPLRPTSRGSTLSLSRGGLPPRQRPSSVPVDLPAALLTAAPTPGPCPRPETPAQGGPSAPSLLPSRPATQGTVGSPQRTATACRHNSPLSSRRLHGERDLAAVSRTTEVVAPRKAAVTSYWDWLNVADELEACGE